MVHALAERVVTLDLLMVEVAGDIIGERLGQLESESLELLVEAVQLLITVPFELTSKKVLEAELEAAVGVNPERLIHHPCLLAPLEVGRGGPAYAAPPP